MFSQFNEELRLCYQHRHGKQTQQQCIFVYSVVCVSVTLGGSNCNNCSLWRVSDFLSIVWWGCFHKTFFSWLPWFESILLDIVRFCLNHTHTHHFKCTGSSLMDFTVGTLMVYCGYCRWMLTVELINKGPNCVIRMTEGIKLQIRMYWTIDIHVDVYIMGQLHSMSVWYLTRAGAAS